MPESSLFKSPPTAEEAFARYVMARDVVRPDLHPGGRPHSADEDAAARRLKNQVRTD